MSPLRTMEMHAVGRFQLDNAKPAQGRASCGRDNTYGGYSSAIVAQVLGPF